MIDAIIDVISDHLLNYVGGTVRYVFGTAYRIIFSMKTYTFRECLNGPNEKGLDYIPINSSHKRSNAFVGLIFILFLILIIYLILH